MLLNTCCIIAGICILHFGRKNLALTLGATTLALGLSLFLVARIFCEKAQPIADPYLSSSPSAGELLSRFCGWASLSYFGALAIISVCAFLFGKFCKPSFYLVPALLGSILVWIISGSVIAATADFTALSIGGLATWFALLRRKNNLASGLCAGILAGWYLGLGIVGFIDAFTFHEISTPLFTAIIQFEVALAQNTPFNPKSISPAFFAIMLFSVLVGAAVEPYWLRFVMGKESSENKKNTSQGITNAKWARFLLALAAMLIGVAATVSIITQIGYRGERKAITTAAQAPNSIGCASPNSLSSDPGNQQKAPSSVNQSSEQRAQSSNLSDALGALGKMAEAAQRVEMTKSPEQRQAELKALQAPEPDKAAEALLRVQMAKTSEQRQAELEMLQAATRALQETGKVCPAPSPEESNDKRASANQPPPNLSDAFGAFGKLAEAAQRVEMKKTPEQRQAELEMLQAATRALQETGKMIPASPAKVASDTTPTPAEGNASAGNPADSKGQSALPLDGSEDRMKAAYVRLRNSLTDAEKAQLKAEQLQWIKDREEQAQPGSLLWNQKAAERAMQLEMRLNPSNPELPFTIPASTLSPNHRFGVTVPIFDLSKGDKVGDSQNKIVEVATERVLAVIRASTGYDRPLNFHKTLPACWSADGSLLVWEVDGKWSPDALVALKIENGEVRWQTDVLKTAQMAILDRTKKAAMEKYTTAKKAKAGKGAAYPEEFTIDVGTSDDISLPLHVQAALTSDPKADAPALEASLEGIVDSNGAFIVTDFHLGSGHSNHF